jgi:hypothetical protein
VPPVPLGGFRALAIALRLKFQGTYSKYNQVDLRHGQLRTMHILIESLTHQHQKTPGSHPLWLVLPDARPDISLTGCRVDSDLESVIRICNQKMEIPISEGGQARLCLLLWAPGIRTNDEMSDDASLQAD